MNIEVENMNLRLLDHHLGKDGGESLNEGGSHNGTCSPWLEGYGFKAR
jgi:hypothetical protein